MTDTQITGPGVVLRFGELFLKGRNRFRFEQALERNVHRAVRGRQDVKVVRHHGRIFLIGASDEDLMARLSGVFGIASLSPVVFCEKDMASITAAALAEADRRSPGVKCFRVSARRSDKQFAHTSADIGRLVGAEVVRATGLGVDLTRFDLAIGIEVGPEWCFIWSTTEKGGGGLPLGTGGRGLLLLSGGIDSPVAGHMMQKRGLALDAVYFHAFPYTGDGAKDKVIDLARLLAARQEQLKLHVVPFTALQELFRDKAPGTLLVILYRRAMIRIAERLADRVRIPALVTGESLGQVASQTLPNMVAIDQVSTRPVLRPLVGFDKAETIELAKRIGSYDISIRPHDDCCSLFVPKHPETKAHLPKVQSVEGRIDWLPALEEAVAQVETITLGPED
jgi:thiamine biosynthesis protein ThiI